MKTKIVDLSDGPRWTRLIAWLENGYLSRAVVLTRDGQPVAVLLTPEAAACAMAIADRLTQREKPFTQEALDHWLDEALAGLNVADFMEDTCGILEGGTK